ncbi:MAG: CaiB/BaiF CoA transferase family protein [Dehalococcoidia bacterium]
MTASALPAGLGGVRVLDLTGEFGSLATRILASLGADVIRIEPRGGHPERRRGPFVGGIPHPERSLVWFQFNAGKRGVTLDLEMADGGEVFRRLVSTAELLIESQPVGRLAGLGLGYEALRSIRPDLVQLSLSPFGQEGPYAHYLASDLIGMAMGGLQYLCGDRDRPPVRPTVEQAYAQAGIQGAVAALIGFWRQQQTGLGAWIDFSMQEGMIWTLANNSLLNRANGSITRRAGGGRAGGTQGNRLIYRAADGSIGFMRRPESHIALQRWFDDLGIDPGVDVAALQGMPTYGEGAPPPESVARIEQALEHFFAQHPKRELVREAQARNLIAAEVVTPRDLVKSDHLEARGFFVEVDAPEYGGAIQAPGAPYISENMPWHSARPPRLGEHNLAIYEGELGYSREELVMLKSLGAI